ncbi:hypothetical protein [Stutzerimonas stutzeri]|nr:hypothetical protein [Stutzerimonas stutzeri]
MVLPKLPESVGALVGFQVDGYNGLLGLAARWEYRFHALAADEA